MGRHYKRRADDNQPEVVQALRLAGFSVCHLHRVGDGCPDLVAGKEGVNVLLELKDGDKPPSRQRLTEKEQQWHDEWKGQVHTVNSPSQAVETAQNVVWSRKRT